MNASGKLQVQEKVAMDETGWFWIRELLIPEMPKLELQSPGYFAHREQAEQDLEQTRHQLFHQLNEVLSDFGFSLGEPSGSRFH